MATGHILGLDIGGANLKAAHRDGTARLRPFALWKQPERLAAALGQLLEGFPAADTLAVTMTGELCDCFETSTQGVLAILDAVQAAARGRRVWVWHRPGRLADLESVRRQPLTAAAANWLALATFAGRFAPQGPALLLDVGSTTSDLIPLLQGRPVPRGWDDSARLKARELVYTGVRRTPICALLQRGVAAELFASILDVYLLLGDIPPDAAATDTADGRPATREHAHARLARMVCGDRQTVPEGRTRKLAQRAARAQVRLLRRALRRVVGRLPEVPRTVLLAGSGEFLARRVLQEETDWGPRIFSLAERLGPAVSGAACAYAVAVLASEQTDD
jgi:probable H4MPT-linked C1 transfer pathway protein